MHGGDWAVEHAFVGCGVVVIGRWTVIYTFVGVIQRIHRGAVEHTIPTNTIGKVRILTQVRASQLEIIPIISRITHRHTQSRLVIGIVLGSSRRTKLNTRMSILITVELRGDGTAGDADLGGWVSEVGGKATGLAGIGEGVEVHTRVAVRDAALVVGVYVQFHGGVVRAVRCAFAGVRVSVLACGADKHADLVRGVGEAAIADRYAGLCEVVGVLVCGAANRGHTVPRGRPIQSIRTELHTGGRPIILI